MRELGSWVALEQKEFYVEEKVPCTRNGVGEFNGPLRRAFGEWERPE